MSRHWLAVLAGCGALFSPAIAFAAAPAPVPAALQKAREALEKGDAEGAVKLLRPEADKGNAEAANALGELSVVGRGTKAAPAEAVKWFQKAADAGNTAAQFNLARLLFLGADGTATELPFDGKSTILKATPAARSATR